MGADQANPTDIVGDDSGTLATHASAETAGTPEWRGNDRYEVVRRIGEGGMGVVYEAFDHERGQVVAVKSLLKFSPAALFRFKQEFRTLADVRHPNLVRLHELVVTAGDNVFFTMELVNGTDFLTYVQKPGTRRDAPPASRVVSMSNMSNTRVDPVTAAPPRLEAGAPSPQPLFRTSPADLEPLRGALRQLVEGVMALHGAGKLHRDIKPSNVLVAQDGRVVVLDFGVATELARVADENLSQADEVVGTVRYMAPEQAVAESLTPASDWYSVGVVLYEALVGRAPFVGSAVEVLTMKALHNPAAPSECVEGVPPDLDSLCLALLDRDAERRPTGLEILRRLGPTGSLRPTTSLPPDVDPGRATALVGREGQLAALREGFEHVRSGRSVTVRLGGASGMGKSVVAQHFLDGLVERGEALVLRGRAYERESVPYKAVDSVIDALSRHLVHLEEQNETIELPADIGALARVFPVLGRVKRIGEIVQTEVTDPNLVRRRAFSALRALLGTLSARQPLVIYVDDVQWGDTDSAALFLELVRPPDAPPVLFVMTHRDEEAMASSFLKEMRNRWPEGAETSDIPVGPLAVADAERLALALLDRSDDVAQRTARAAARESRGSPFLVEELVRHNVNIAGRPEGDTLDGLSLEQMVAQRLERLPDDARRLLEVVAVGGRPLPVSVIAQASGAGDGVERAIAAAHARRFLRTGLRDGREIVEMSHDRFRETIVEQLSASKVREHHGHLARALEDSPGADAEAVSRHLLGAGDPAGAARFAERAAEEAIAKLAFDQGARLLRMTLETVSLSPEETRRLRVRLATVLEWSGRAEEAARAYLAAAEQAPPLERLDFERAAAAQLVAAGRIDEGAAAFRGLLAAVGRAVPSSPLGILFWVVIYRLASVFLLRSELREGDGLRPEEKVRLDAMQAVARALTLVDPLSAMYVKARYLVDALRSGNHFHIMRAATAEAATLASGGKHESPRERALFATAKRLAERSGDEEGLGLYEIAYGICEYLRGRWTSSVELLDRAYSRLVGLRRWQANASVYRVYALTARGDLPEVRSQTERLLADAEQRGDLYTAVNLRGSHPMAAWMAADDVEGARRHLRESIANWSHTRFFVQHWQCMLWETEAHLYSGEGAHAWQRLARDERPLRGSLLLRVQLIRSLTLFVRGRSAVASLEGIGEPERGERLAAAHGAQDRLQRERMPWTDALAAMLAASVAGSSGDAAAAESALRRAIALADAVEMALHAAAARRCLGSLLGGEAGNALVKEAEETMKTRGVRVPARYAQMLVPGAAWRPR